MAEPQQPWSSQRRRVSPRALVPIAGDGTESRLERSSLLRTRGRYAPVTERSLGGCVTLAGAICPYRDAVNWRGGRVFGFVSVALYAAIALGFIARSADGALTMPSNSDWVAFAVGAHLLRSGGCLYCVGSQIAATHAMGLAPGDGINPFVSLPPVGFVFQPLGLLAPEQGIAARWPCARRSSPPQSR